MLCRVEMPTNDQIYGRFYRWKLMNMGGGGTKFMLLGLPALLAVFAVWSFFTGLGLTATALFLLIFGYSMYSLFIKPGQLFKKRAGAALETEVYIFSPTGFVRNVRSEESGQLDHASHQYDVLVRAVETKSDFFLFYGPETAYLVDKEYFTKGTPDELRAILREKLGDKFKTKQG